MSRVQSVDRVLNILETISKSDRGMGISELSKSTNLHKSTVHRLVSALVENEYLYQSENSKYKLTFKLYEVGSRAVENLSVLDAARSVIEKLAEEVEEVVHLVVRNESEVVYVDKKNPSSHSSIMGSRVGSSNPMYCTAVGKSLLFDSDEKEIQKMWNSSIIKKITENTITDFSDFQEEIEKSKSRGYAIDDEENEKGIRCLGAPIRNYKNEIVAAISVSGPITRVNEENIEEYTKPLLKAVKEISRRLGYMRK